VRVSVDASVELLKPLVADGEWDRTLKQEGLWLSIDGIGTGRNITTAIGSGTEIAGTSAKVASVCGGGIVPILQVVGGVLVVGSALRDTIPKAYEEYKGARAEYEMAVFSRDQEKLDYAEEGVAVATLGLANQSLYCSMGGGLIAAGTTTMMGPATAHLMGFNPVVGAMAGAAAGAALGGIYVLRGGVVIGRAAYNLYYLNRFEKEFKTALAVNEETQECLEEAVEKALAVINKPGEGSLAQQRRIGDAAKITPETLEEKIRLLEKADQELYTKKLQQKVSLIIGIAMVIGGLASIAAVVFSGGLALPLIALISAIAFTAMEGIYATYDSSYLFEKVRARLYKPSQEIQDLRALHERLKLQEEADSSLSRLAE